MFTLFLLYCAVDASVHRLSAPQVWLQRHVVKRFSEAGSQSKLKAAITIQMHHLAGIIARLEKSRQNVSKLPEAKKLLNQASQHVAENASAADLQGSLDALKQMNKNLMPNFEKKETDRIQEAANLSIYARKLYFPKTREEALGSLDSEFGSGNWIELKTGHGKTAGFFGYKPDKKEFIFTARGSRDPWDIKMDIQDWPTKVTVSGLKFEVHSGFYKRFLTVRKPLIDFIQKMLKQHKVSIEETSLLSVGHSLGGSVAHLTVISLRDSLKFRKLTLITFGEPAVGRGPGWQEVNEGIEEIRVFSPKDWVPKLTSYEHTGKVFYLNYHYFDSDVNLPHKIEHAPGLLGKMVGQGNAK